MYLNTIIHLLYDLDVIGLHCMPCIALGFMSLDKLSCAVLGLAETIRVNLCNTRTYWSLFQTCRPCLLMYTYVENEDGNISRRGGQVDQTCSMVKLHTEVLTYARNSSRKNCSEPKIRSFSSSIG